MTRTGHLIVSIEPGAPLEDLSAVRSLLENANTEFGYPRNERKFIAILRDSAGKIQGGIKCAFQAS